MGRAAAGGVRTLPPGRPRAVSGSAARYFPTATGTFIPQQTYDQVALRARPGRASRSFARSAPDRRSLGGATRRALADGDARRARGVPSGARGWRRLPARSPAPHCSAARPIAAMFWVTLGLVGAVAVLAVTSAETAARRHDVPRAVDRARDRSAQRRRRGAVTSSSSPPSNSGEATMVVVVAGTLAAGEESMEYVADDLGVAGGPPPRTPTRALDPCGHDRSARAATNDQATAAGRPAHAYREGRDDRPDAAMAGRSRRGRSYRPHLPRPRPPGLLRRAARAGVRQVERTLARPPVRWSPFPTRSVTIWSSSASRQRTDRRDPVRIRSLASASCRRSERAARRSSSGWRLSSSRRIRGAADPDQASARPHPNARVALRASGVDGALVIVGDGQDRRAAEHLAGELGIAASCRFLGFRRDLQTLVYHLAQ